MWPAIGICLWLFAVGSGFHEAFGWDAVETIFAMVLMVPGAGLLTDKLLYPATEQRFEINNALSAGFVVFTLVLAFFVYAVGDSPLNNIDNALMRYATTLWCVFPYSCGALVVADRVFNLFGSKGRGSKRAKPLPPVPPRWPFDVKPDANNVIDFDPKRFK